MAMEDLLEERGLDDSARRSAAEAAATAATNISATDINDDDRE